MKKSTPPLKAYFSTINGNCGIGYLFGMNREEYRDDPWAEKYKIGIPATAGGAGWTLAGFVETPECREAYDVLCASYNLVYQSPVRTNNNSGRPFFFCIFDVSKQEKAIPAGWKMPTL